MQLFEAEQPQPWSEVRGGLTCLLAVAMLSVAAKEVSGRWRRQLDEQTAADRLQTRLWGWDAAPAPLRRADNLLRWASLGRLVLGAVATSLCVTGALRAAGIGLAVAALAPAVSLGGAVLWREFGDVTVAEALADWPALRKRVLSWARRGGQPVVHSAMPTVILTGFLGAGKTTLLNRLLRDGRARGQRFAVIENEVGAVGIDGQLLAEGMTAKERESVVPSFVELSDGCVCCTVRGDLQDALRSLLPKLRAQRVDTLLLETTGLAEPGPVVQTFLADRELRASYCVNSVVTVVDAKHVLQHLESTEVPLSAEVRQLSSRMRQLKDEQRAAKKTMMAAGADVQLGRRGGIKDAANAAKEIKRVTKDLDEAQAKFEACRKRLRSASMSGKKTEAAQQIAFADKIVINKVDLAADVADVSNAIAAVNPHADVVTTSDAKVDFDWVLARRPLTADAAVEAAAKEASKGQPHAYETMAGFCRPCTDTPSPVLNKPWHLSNSGVASMSFRSRSPVVLPRFNRWVFGVLEEHGGSIYRYKGVLSVSGDDQRYVLQGVHMVFTGQPASPWGDGETRQSQLVLIGRNLPTKELEEGFRATLLDGGEESLLVK